jgi:Tol biopolymer transport system component
MVVGVPVGIMGAFALLLVVVLVASGLGPGLQSPALSPGSTVDYGQRPAGPIAPLDARFIAAAFGSAVPLASATSALQAAGLPGSTSRVRRIVEDHPGTNDNRREARPIAGVPYTARTDSRAATRSPDDPDDCAALGGTVWYRFRADQAMRLVASTAGTDHGVSLGVFRDGADGLSLVGCDTDVRGAALLPFLAESGGTYLFQITAPAGGGNLVFSLDPYGAIRRVSVGARGEAPDAPSRSTSVSADGRYVAFASYASNLVDGSGSEDTPCLARGGPVPENFAHGPCSTIWVRDMHSGEMEVASVSDSGEPANAEAYWPSVSANGRFVVFVSIATNLGDGGQVGADIFIRDRHRRVTDRVPLPPVPVVSQYENLLVPTISDDGRYVVFQTGRPVLPDDTNGVFDVYVFDRAARDFVRATVSSSGEQAAPTDQSTTYRGLTGTEPALVPSISGDGRWITFRSNAPNLVPGDTNETWDTFVHDRSTRRTERASVTSTGAQADGQSLWNRPSASTLSADGRYVVFVSDASNLVPGDGNGIADVFVRDRVEGTTLRVSHAWDAPAMRDQLLWWPTISRDGRFVAWESNVTETNAFCGVGALGGGGCEATSDVFRYDRITDSVLPLTLPTGEGDSYGSGGSLAGDGMHVVFVSSADNLAGPTGGLENVFLFTVGSMP